MNDDTHVCECGHPINTHPGADYGRASCVATVLTNAPLGGGSTYQCSCKTYSEVGGNMHADTLITYAEHLQLTEALVAERDQARLDAMQNIAAGPIGRIAKRYGWLPADEAEELRADLDRERARADRAEKLLGTGLCPYCETCLGCGCQAGPVENHDADCPVEHPLSTGSGGLEMT